MDSYGLTRSLPLPVLTRSKRGVRLLRQSVNLLFLRGVSLRLKNVAIGILRRAPGRPLISWRLRRVFGRRGEFRCRVAQARAGSHAIQWALPTPPPGDRVAQLPRSRRDEIALRRNISMPRNVNTTNSATSVQDFPLQSAVPRRYDLE